MRLRRLEQGNFGDSKHIRERLYELRLFLVPAVVSISAKMMQLLCY